MTARDGKPCKKCHTSEWYSNGNCKQCRKESDRRWNENHPEKRAAANRRWIKNNPERHAENCRRWAKDNPERNSELTLRWNKNNPEKHAAGVRRWQKANPEKHAAYNRQWIKDNPENAAARSARRRALKTKAGGSYTADEWKALVEHYGGKCLCCGRNDVKLHADHVIPISSGGTSNIDNIQPLCQSCNSSKGRKTIDYRPGKGFGRWIQRKLFG